MSRYTSPNRRHDRRFFYKYMPSETARIVLANRTLRWSSPVLFNDPFDIHPDTLHFDGTELQQALMEEIASLLCNPECTVVADPRLEYMLDVARKSTPERRAAMAVVTKEYKPFVPDPTNDSLQELKEVWSDMVSNMRVLCLSEVNDLTAMWAHYAASATGVVLQFEAVDGLDSPLLVARPVTYEDSPPAITRAREWARLMTRSPDWQNDMSLFDNYEHTKTTEWRSEKEWRISSMKRRGEIGEYSDYPFNVRELSAVYFGWRCTKGHRADITSLLSHGLDHVKVFSTYPDPRSRRYVFEEARRA